jgi:hypothetical protein
MLERTGRELAGGLVEQIANGLVATILNTRLYRKLDLIVKCKWSHKISMSMNLNESRCDV